MKDKFDVLVYIGRFQPFTEAHREIVRRARNMADNVVILVGSSGEPRTIKNPLTFDERKEIISNFFTDVNIFPIYDFPYDDVKWLSGARKVVEEFVNSKYSNKKIKIGLIGHSKDNSSYYLNMFPYWKGVNVENISNINATDIRNHFYENKSGEIDSNKLHGFVTNKIKTFYNSDVGEELITAYKDNKKYIEMWKVAPYPPTFVTVDAVVIQSGHILLIERKNNPGKGLFALPGGFVEHNLTIKENLIKELREETRLKVVDKVILGSIKSSHVFDYPKRSIRGRTITHAFFVDLGYYPELPVVKGGDDASKAMWVPLSKLKRDNMFEDHIHIIDHFCNIL